MCFLLIIIICKVARFDTRGAGEILRKGPKRASETHGTVPPLERSGQLSFRIEEKEAKTRQSWWSRCGFWNNYFPNFILQWHALSKEDQSKYYDLARHERQVHLSLYPGWTARDNYAKHKKKRRKRDKIRDEGRPEKREQIFVSVIMICLNLSTPAPSLCLCFCFWPYFFTLEICFTFFKALG